MQVFEARDDERVGSTDMGNVMQVLPAIHPYIAIAADPVPGHSIAFRDLAVTQGALENALVAAKALALTALDVLTDAGLLQRARAEFDDRRRVGVVKGRAS
jgi:metal-dependent amidase/aminoacylase/carboxypeptidase family protein